ncbi:HAD family hydrolase [Pontibacter akesuensis]|uniref:2-haloacid dehalogenase n=1 Tax=Pontibacter akesuensis TaxID=388950 RepID=A0A1I7I0L4_9BACT|nr:HAD family phosphatase [Pontibacter akesuensis]GHA64565.1 hydrolase [Pontibacter akesuensis]SFU66477.1 2-haloacid dehalogenase [Pontibacter akesuensis]
MIKTIIFDLGAVLIDWNPHYLYRKLFKEEAEMLHFLENICTPDWNEEQDAGRSLKEATDMLVAQYPEQEENIKAFYGRWDEMLGGAIEGTVEIFRELKDSGKYNIYALTNWSAETWPVAVERFDFLNWFDGVVVSGTEKDRKPFDSFYHTLLNRYDVQPSEALFIDDNLRNIKAAEKLGIESIHFTSPEELRKALEEKGVL